MSNTQNNPYADDRGKSDVAKEHAAGLKDHAVGAGQDLGGQAKVEAQGVAQDAKHEIRGLFDAAREESRGQLRGGQSKLAGSVRTLSQEVHEMAQGGEQHGQASKLARTLASSGDDLANWIERSEPADVVDSVRRYASRNPMTFLALAAGAGLLVGRFARGFQAEQGNDYSRNDYSRNDYARDTFAGDAYAGSQGQHFRGDQTPQATYAREPQAPAYSDYSRSVEDDYTTQTGVPQPGVQGQSWRDQSGSAYDRPGTDQVSGDQGFGERR